MKLFDMLLAAAGCEMHWATSLNRFTALWRDKQLQYTWLRARSGRRNNRAVAVKSAKTEDCTQRAGLANTCTDYKTLIDEDSGRILGAHIVGPHADEVINIFGLAMRHNLTAEDLKTTIVRISNWASDVGYML